MSIQCAANHPAVLIIGKTGAGKSTLGNILLGRDEFDVSDSAESTTQVCKMSRTKINEGTFNIIDTPGIFNPDKDNQEILNGIAETILKCAYEIKAIIFVIEATRFTEEQRDTTDRIIKFLGEESLNYMIAVFSKCRKAQTINPDLLFDSLAQKEKEFLKSIGNRFTISPNLDTFDKNNQIVTDRMTDLKNYIAGISDFYTANAFEKIWNLQKRENVRQTKDSSSQRLMRSVLQFCQYLMQLFGISRLFHYLTSRLGLSQQLDNRQCFAADSEVTLQNGKIKRISDLAIGDYVYCGSENGTKAFSEVYLIIHADPNATTEFQLIDFVKQDGSQGKLRITPEHHIFVNNGKTDFAKNVIPNKTELFVSDGEKFVLVTPTCITKEQRKGYYSPLTRSGTILVDEVLCSCYASAPPYQALINFAFMPLRIYTKIFPSNRLDKEIHPYAKFLNMGRLIVQSKFSQIVSSSFVFYWTYTTFIHLYNKQ